MHILNMPFHWQEKQQNYRTKIFPSRAMIYIIYIYILYCFTCVLPPAPSCTMLRPTDPAGMYPENSEHAKLPVPYATISCNSFSFTVTQA